MTTLKAPSLTALTAARDELYRELMVRTRLFPRWVDEGKVSLTDAQDRLDRIHTAWTLLQGMAEGAVPVTVSEVVTRTGDMTHAPA